MSETIIRRAKFQLKNYDDSPIHIEVVLKEKGKGLKYYLLDELRRWSLAIISKEYDLGTLVENIEHKSLSSDNIEDANLEFTNECLSYYVQELKDEKRDNYDTIPRFLYSESWSRGGDFINFIPEKKEYVYSLFLPDDSSRYVANSIPALEFRNNVDWIQKNTGIVIDLSLSSSKYKNALEWRLDNKNAILYRHLAEEVKEDRRAHSYHLLKTDTVYKYPNSMELLHCILYLNNYPYHSRIADSAKITDDYYSLY